jgi:hypothetical protein
MPRGMRDGTARAHQLRNAQKRLMAAAHQRFILQRARRASGPLRTRPFPGIHGWA